MLFVDIHGKYLADSAAAIRELFITASKNQRHSGDLLLVILEGHYKPNKFNFAKLSANAATHGMKLLEYDIEDNDVIWPEVETNNVIKIIADGYNCTSSEFIAETQNINDTKDGEKINQYWKHVYTVVGLEFLIYLKVWEMDSYIRKLFQISELAIGNGYDWYLETANKTKIDPTLHKIAKNELRDRLIKNLKTANCNQLALLIEDSFSGNLRNAIAHSQYYLINQNIDLVKYNEYVTVDAWLNKLYPLTLAIYKTFIDEVYNTTLPQYVNHADKHMHKVPVMLGDGIIVNLKNRSQSGYGSWSF